MKVLLYSGGVDSWLISKLWKPDVLLYINIHGSYSDIELRNLPEGTLVVDFPFLGTTEQEGTRYIPLRNLYFLMIASTFGDELCLGATAGDRGCADKTPEFLQMAEDVLNTLLAEQSVAEGRTIRIERRFVEMSKDQMMKEYLAGGGDIETAYRETFSCFNPSEDGSPCMACKPCFRRFVTFYNNGYRFKPQDISKMRDYIAKRVVSRSSDKSGTYYKDRYIEGADCERAVRRLMGE